MFVLLSASVSGATHFRITLFSRIPSTTMAIQVFCGCQSSPALRPVFGDDFLCTHREVKTALSCAGSLNNLSINLSNQDVFVPVAKSFCNSS